MTVRVLGRGVAPRSELERLRHAAGWTTGTLARRLPLASGGHVPEATVRAWDAGLRPARSDVLAWLREVVAAQQGVPPPVVPGKPRRVKATGEKIAVAPSMPVDKQL